jgi:hypothetical protein
MRNSHQCGIGIQRCTLERIFRPFAKELCLAKPLQRRKGAARIDDCQVESGNLRHAGKRLGNMDRTDGYDPGWRQIDIDENRASADLDDAGFSGA